MSKLRSDAIWNILTPEQREKIEDWLLEQNLSFREAHERAHSELGLTCSLTTVRRMYALLLKWRAMEELARGQAAAADLCGAGANMGDLRESSMKLIVARLLEKAMARGEVKEIYALGRLMLQSQEREIQQDRVSLARERFEFKAASAALKVLPLLDELSEEDEARELARIRAIRKKIFGTELDGVEDRERKIPIPSDQGGPHKAT